MFIFNFFKDNVYLIEYQIVLLRKKVNSFVYLVEWVV